MCDVDNAFQKLKAASNICSNLYTSESMKSVLTSFFPTYSSLVYIGDLSYWIQNGEGLTAKMSKKVNQESLRAVHAFLVIKNIGKQKKEEIHHISKILKIPLTNA